MVLRGNEAMVEWRTAVKNAKGIGGVPSAAPPFVHHESYCKWPGIEGESPQWEADT